MAIRGIEDIRLKCAPVLDRTPARKAIVFGSWAHGTQSRHSDIDIIVIEKTKKRFFERYRDFDELFEVLKEHGIDLLVYTPEEIESMGHRRFIQKALSEGVTIYER